MLEASHVELARGGKRKHPNLPVRSHAPVWNVASRQTVNVAATALAPWNTSDYPGRLKILREALLGRAKDITIRDWRRGRRRPPQWAIDLLIDALESRKAALDHAIALLKNEKGRN